MSEKKAVEIPQICLGERGNPEMEMERVLQSPWDLFQAAGEGGAWAEAGSVPTQGGRGRGGCSGPQVLGAGQGAKASERGRKD